MKIVYHIPPSADPVPSRHVSSSIRMESVSEPDGKLRSNGGEFEYEAKAGSKAVNFACVYLDKQQQNSSRVMHLVRWDNAEGTVLWTCVPMGCKVT